MSKPKILVTGNLGYIGSVLVPELIRKGYEVVGYDTNYYNIFLCDSELLASKQILKDIRDVTIDDVQDIDAVIHLAALSNDPLGELSPGLTEEINLGGTIKLAMLAKEARVRRFV